MDKKTLILGTNQKGFDETGKIIGKFILLCFLMSISLTIYSYIKFFGIIAFIGSCILMYLVRNK